MGRGGTEMCRSTARSTVDAWRQWAHKRARHRRGAGRASKAKWRTDFSPRGRCTDLAGAYRAARDERHQFSHSPHAPLTGAELSLLLERSALRSGSFGAGAAPFTAAAYYLIIVTLFSHYV